MKKLLPLLLISLMLLVGCGEEEFTEPELKVVELEQLIQSGGFSLLPSSYKNYMEQANLFYETYETGFSFDTITSLADLEEGEYFLFVSFETMEETDVFYDFALDEMSEYQIHRELNVVIVTNLDDIMRLF